MPRRKRSKVKKYFTASIEIIILLVFLPIIYNLGLFTFLGYLLAMFIAFKEKLIFKKNIAGLIILGTLLSILIGYLLPFALSNYNSGDYISASIMFILIVLIFVKSRNLKKGKK